MAGGSDNIDYVFKVVLTDRGLGAGEVAVTGAVRAERVQPGLQGHDRGGVPNEDPHHPAQKRQGPDLGHRRSGEVQSCHQCILPRSSWGFAGLRHYQVPKL